MGQTLTLSAEDGHQLSAYRATPAATPRGGLVVIQEIFGVNSHIKKVTDGWAADGYVALAPALFDRVERGVDIGYSAEDIQQGRELRGKISTDDSVRDVRAAVRELARAGLRVGVVGYCWGGTMAWLAATRIDGLSATVGYYGGGIAETAEESPRCAVMLHFGRPTRASRRSTTRRCGASIRRSPSTSIPPAMASAATRGGATTSRARAWRASGRSPSSASTSARLLTDPGSD